MAEIEKLVPKKALSIAQNVLRQESEALTRLERALDDKFLQAVELIEKIKGRVIVVGMGKSGHVARKIAATLASTGTPAFFVHPAEAGHGDLGMITAEDIVLALSNSGNTVELSVLVTYTRRFGIPLVSITSGAQSTLAEKSDLVLLLPQIVEACPLGLAPTTSTTMMMALGDALAVTLLERRNFSAQDYHQFHPGGSLGKGLVRVAEIMHKDGELPLASQDISMSEAILVMTAKSFGCVGLVNEKGCLVGVITDGDLRRHMAPDLLKQPASRVMTLHPKTIRPQALVAEALAMMNLGDRRITSLFVVENEHPQGIIHIHDCLRVGVA